MKNILCFGDSNTWGYDPVTHARYEYHERWPGIVQNSLGNGYRIIEEGQNGRTTVWPDPIEGFKCGKDYLIPCLETHSPLDLVIIMLGTNDLKKRFGLTAFDVSAGAAVLVNLVNSNKYGNPGKSPEVLLVSPTLVGDLHNSWLSDLFGKEEATITSLELGMYFARVAELAGCHYLDAAKIALPSTDDGLHFNREGHLKIGSAIALKIIEITA